ncbi:MAG: MFS transporter [Saprospiraceae bacterium]|nr:MFS transporter [Saprospiraceae bacterium]
MAKRLYQPAPHQALHPERPPIRVLVLYAIGQLGWSLASFAAGNLMVYFFMPPEQGTPLFPSYIYQGAVLGVFTLIGIVSAGGRILDGLVDPLVANWSDRRRSTLGKRRWFLLIGATPFAVFATLIFFPVDPSESAGNFMWLVVCTALYYFFFAFYVIPYNALMAELGHTAKDRMLISTLVSVTWALGFVAGNGVFALQGWLETEGKTPVQAFQYALVFLHAIALCCMLLPALFLQENRYARQITGDQSFREALQTIAANRNFRRFLGSFLLYWLALTFIQLGMVYYATLLFHLEKEAAFTFSLISFLSSFILYVPVNLLVQKWGKRRTMLAAYLLFGVLFAIVAFVGIFPEGSKKALLYALGVAAAAPLAIFGILPNALVGDEIVKEEQQSGKQLSGMFYGITAFTMKIGISLANLTFPSLLLVGKSREQPMGVQATALVALLFCITGWYTFRRYRED